MTRTDSASFLSQRLVSKPWKAPWLCSYHFKTYPYQSFPLFSWRKCRVLGGIWATTGSQAHLKILSQAQQTVDTLQAGSGWRHPLAECAQVKQAGERFVQPVPTSNAFTVSSNCFMLGFSFWRWTRGSGKARAGLLVYEATSQSLGWARKLWSIVLLCFPLSVQGYNICNLQTFPGHFYIFEDGLEGQKIWEGGDVDGHLASLGNGVNCILSKGGWISEAFPFEAVGLVIWQIRSPS